MNLSTLCPAVDYSSLIWIAPGVQIPRRAWTVESESILTKEAVQLLACLHRRHGAGRVKLLAERVMRQRSYDQGEVPSYLVVERKWEESKWRVSTIPPDLLRRRAEVVGPANSVKRISRMFAQRGEEARPDCIVLDFEDSMRPLWGNVVRGMQNVVAAVTGTPGGVASVDEAYAGQSPLYGSKDLPTLIVRCRGLHLFESNFIVDGEPISAGLFDLALCFLHTADELVDSGRTPAYYVPKCEDYLEARWWNGLFSDLEQKKLLPCGTLRATFLIETLPAAFQAEEILFEIRQHAAGLGVGRVDRLFSDIKTLKLHKNRILADLDSIGPEESWLLNSASRVVEVCHRRGALAMGGLSAFVPAKENSAHEQQVARVSAEKAFEAELGFDGSCVYHPSFVSATLAQFKNNNQLTNTNVLAQKYPQLLPKGDGPRTRESLRKNARSAIAWMHGWNNGCGCVAWDEVVEDLASLEMSRAQTWQWLHHGIALDCGSSVTRELVEELFQDEFFHILSELEPTRDEAVSWSWARKQVEELFLNSTFREFFSFASDPVV